MKKEEMQSIKRHICQLNALLEIYNDELKHSDQFENFIYSFLQIQPKNTFLPIMEVMTVLKYEKPCIFQELVKNESNGDIMIPITMDIRTAEKNLDQLLVQHM